MAIIKHLNIKNSHYEKAVEYLVYKHDEMSNKPLKDSNGNLIPRENIILDGINCNPQNFAWECISANRKFGKNNRKGETKAHHYILSFDPKDRDDNGLTMDRAQEIGMEFARKHFSGYQTIVCTHDDGHNHSGNIHVHIVINSLRIKEIEQKPYMTQRSDYISGGKHRASDELMDYLKSDLMEICENEKLYQVDLFSPPKLRVVEREYWAKHRGLNTDKTFKTDKENLREIINEVLSRSKSLADFETYLYNDYKIEVKYSRGKIAYILPDRQKPIRGRVLGTDFEKEHIIAVTKSNSRAKRHSPQIKIITDIENNTKAQNSRAYANAVGVSNIKKMADTLGFLDRIGIRSISELDIFIKSGEKYIDEIYAEYSEIKTKLEKINLQIKYTGQYLSTKEIYSQYLAADDKKSFRAQHSEELSLYESARKEIRALSSDGKFKSMKELKAEKEELTKLRNEQYDELSLNLSKLREYKNVRENLEIMSNEKMKNKDEILL